MGIYHYVSFLEGPQYDFSIYEYKGTNLLVNCMVIPVFILLLSLLTWRIW